MIGAGGHGRSVISLLHDCEIEVQGVYDDAYRPEVETEILGRPVFGRISDAPATKGSWVLAIGDNQRRAELFDAYRANVRARAAVHSSAVVDASASLGDATLVFAGVYVGPEVSVGANAIVNVGAVIEHECTTGDHVHVAPGVVICGRVQVGNRCLLGAGVIIKNDVHVGDDVILGAGAVVTDNIGDAGTYAGVPARRIG